MWFLLLLLAAPRSRCKCGPRSYRKEWELWVVQSCHSGEMDPDQVLDRLEHWTTHRNGQGWGQAQPRVQNLQLFASNVFCS